MSVVISTVPSEPWEDHTARFSAEWGPSLVVITAHGELDASNANRLADYVQSCAAHSKSLIVNLSGLEFFGTAGFSALHTINVRCAGADGTRRPALTEARQTGDVARQLARFFR